MCSSDLTVMLNDSSALFLWMEVGTAENAAGIYARRLYPDGSLSVARLISDSTQARTSGFPRAAVRPSGRVVMSWTRAGTPNQILVSEIDPGTFVPAKSTVLTTPRKIAPVGVEICLSPTTEQ